MSGAELSAIIVAVVGVLGTAIAALIKFGSDYVIKKLEIKEQEKKVAHFKENLEGVRQDIENHSKIDVVCEEIRKYVGATKCNVWMFHNGGYYYTGSAIQRISIVAGVSEDLQEDIKTRFTNIPVGIFARNLQKLLDADYAHEKNELAYQDTLGVINSQYHVTSSALFKLMSVNTQDWIGMLSIGFIDHKELTEPEIQYIKSRLGEITRLLTPKLLL